MIFKQLGRFLSGCERLAPSASRCTAYDEGDAAELVKDGSVLFFLGGVFNYWRVFVVLRDQMRAQASP